MLVNYRNNRAGPRENMPMIILNCAALPESLMEDELFGHEKGAFTGAEGQKIGKFEQADGGTIFLDEIGEMSPGMQAKTLPKKLPKVDFEKIFTTA